MKIMKLNNILKKKKNEKSMLDWNIIYFIVGMYKLTYMRDLMWK